MNNNLSEHDIVLASASPRRLELLLQLGWSPEVLPVNINESIHQDELATDYCQRMAIEKSESARIKIRTELPIITADTIVVVDGVILGKPKSRIDAELTLIKLSGREHQVYSAVSVYHNDSTLTVLSANSVKMANISRQQIAAYIATEEPMDKAGSYGIQGYAAMWIECIQGSYSSIMGLPLFETTELLKDLNILSPLDLIK